MVVDAGMRFKKVEGLLPFWLLALMPLLLEDAFVEAVDVGHRVIVTTLLPLLLLLLLLLLLAG